MGRALRQASACADISGDTCILSHEVAFDTPSLFIYDTKALAMRGLLAPRRIPSIADGETPSDPPPLTIAVQRPGVGSKKSVPMVIEIEMNHSVTIEYFDLVKLAMREERLVGDDAYCFQLLMHTLSNECVEALQK